MSEFFLGGVWDRPTQPGSISADTRADSAKRSAEALANRLDRAMLTMEAMWTLLREGLDVTDRDLAERVVESDMSDGRLDGTVRRPPLECSSCHRVIPRRFARCMYCAADVQLDPFG